MSLGLRNDTTITTFIYWTFSRTAGVNWYQNATILDFIGAVVDRGGGDSWRYETGNAPVKPSPPTDHHQPFLPVVLLIRMFFLKRDWPGAELNTKPTVMLTMMVTNETRACEVTCHNRTR